MLLPFFHLEDVFVTGFGAQACDAVAVLEGQGFYSLPSSLAKVNVEEAIVLHYKTPAAMQQLFKVREN